MIVSVGRMMRKGGGGLIWPKGLKESIKAIYDPAKQGMTNYDVIEAYVEDFTNWNYVKARGVATISQHKFIITECILKGLGIVEDIQEPYSNLTVRIIGITDNQEVLITDYVNGQHQIINTITEDGIYTIEDRHHFVGFGCNFVGTCNITIEQLPTSILKDFSGNRHDAYLYGFKGRLNSGVGIYAQDFTKWIFGSAIHNISTKAHNKLHIVKKNPNNYFGFTIGIQKANYYNKPYKLKFNFNKEINDIKFSIVSTDGNLITTQCFSAIINNGSVVDVPIISEEIFNNQKEPNIYYDFGTNKDIEIDVKLIPDYPNQLCYDGKSYAVAYDMPILTDYTVMAERTWFERQNRACFLSKITTSGTGAFGFEFYNEYNEDTTYSFGRANNVEYFKDGITYQITNSYNGIVKLDYIVNGKDNAELYIGKLRPSERSAFIGCHGAIIIADRSFTEEEINWLKNNLFTIDIPTPAYDFDFSKYKDGSNLGDSITDKYGNVLELHNFAWKGMSGLGGYPIDLKATFPRNYTDGRDYICNDKEITCSYIGKSGLFQVLMVKQDITKYIEIPEFTIKISGSENINLTYHYIKEDFTKGLLNIVGNGIYKIPKSYKADKIVENLNWLGFVLQNHMDENVDLKLEILPIYPGALVFDGIDDYARLAKMTIKTVVLDFVNLELDKQVYDNRDKPNNHNYFSIYPQADTVAYEARNSNGKTYINGELNTTIKTNDLLGVRCITCASNDLAKETEQYICRDSYLNNYYGKIALYRITGFTEMLTADQVWKWYQKNKAKGGDK